MGEGLRKSGTGRIQQNVGKEWYKMAAVFGSPLGMLSLIAIEKYKSQQCGSKGHFEQAEWANESSSSKKFCSS